MELLHHFTNLQEEEWLDKLKCVVSNDTHTLYTNIHNTQAYSYNMYAYNDTFVYSVKLLQVQPEENDGSAVSPKVDRV